MSGLDFPAAVGEIASAASHLRALGVALLARKAPDGAAFPAHSLSGMLVLAQRSAAVPRPARHCERLCGAAPRVGAAQAHATARRGDRAGGAAAPRPSRAAPD